MSEYYITTDGELYHFGVKGMKWGVRRDKQYRSDNRTRRKLKRRVAAAANNLKAYGKISNADEREYHEAEKAYRKAQSRVFSFGSKRRAEIEAASRALSEAGDKVMKSRAELNRAERIYDKAADKYTAHVNAMINRHGSDNVKNIKTKDVNIGEMYVKDMIKTGITLADMPLIGKAYSGSYISREEHKDRNERINRRSESYY